MQDRTDHEGADTYSAGDGKPMESLRQNTEKEGTLWEEL